MDSSTFEDADLQAEIRAKVAAGGLDGIREALRLAESLRGPSSTTAGDDDVAQTLYELVLNAEVLEDWELCSALYERVASYNVVNPHVRAAAWFRFGLCRERQGDLAGAVKGHRWAIPDAAGWPLVEGLARFRLAQLLAAAEDYSAAAELFSAIVAANLPHAEISAGSVILNWARCLWRLGNAVEARALLENPPHPLSDEVQIDALRLLAEIYEAIGDTERAAECYRSIVQSAFAEPQLKSAAGHRLAALRPARAPIRLPALRLSDQLLVTDAAEGRFVVIANDVGISRAILDTGCWAAPDVALFKRLIEPGDTVFDIGANIGHHSVVFSKLAGDSGSVISVEPQAFLFNVLCANLAVNKCSNTRACQVALGDHEGWTQMLPVDYGREGNFGALGLSVHADWLTGERVRLATLDGMAADFGSSVVSFIKIDVQTFELFVLRGGTRTLTQHNPTLFIEISPYWMRKMNDYDYREIYRFLVSLGYQIYDKRLRLVDIERVVEGDENTEWDVLAMKGRPRPRLPI
jgi:FkbM family methyltransferase